MSKSNSPGNLPVVEISLQKSTQFSYKLHQSDVTNTNTICVNRPAIVREIPPFGLNVPHFRQKVPHFWLNFEITKIVENRNNFSCRPTEIFCSKKLCENVSDSVTYFDSKIRQKSLKIAIMFTVGDILFEKARRKRQ